MRPQVLIIALIIILGGIAGSIFLTRTPDTTKETVQADAPTPITYDVWIARKTLQRGQTVDRTDLKLISLSQEQAREKGVRENSTLTFAKGMAANTAIEADQVVFPSMVTRPDQDGYFSLLIEPGQVPFPIQVSSTSVLAGVIQPGTYVDVLALSARNQNLANAASVKDFKSMTVSPVLMGVRVLQVRTEEAGEENEKSASQKTSLILGLSRKQASTALIARKMAELEVQVSNGDTAAAELSADTGDVVSSYRSIKEFRAQTTTVY